MPSTAIINSITLQKPKPETGDNRRGLWNSVKGYACKVQEMAYSKVCRIFKEDKKSEETGPNRVQMDIMRCIPSGVRSCCSVFAEGCAWICCLLMVLNVVPAIGMGIWGLNYQARHCTPDSSGRITAGNVSMEAPVRQSDVFKWLDPTNGLDDADTLHAWDRPETVLRKLCFEVVCEHDEKHGQFIQTLCMRVIGWKEASHLWGASVAVIVCGASQIMGMVILALEKYCGGAMAGLWLFFIGFAISLIYYCLIAGEIHIYIKALSW
ncbi:uncharacterized protein LOC129586649 [Paramacrobiotus metropolitanus]|uniref:uncharacterized protein LOC129586649 n=1 Tax=Paramacrobiotus metropolitanus TaxID=2943436 RepID=UPI002445A73C|nr:uncharacterized protein LOC129586649 [Paramacrobiotus metropolitanus]